MTPLPLSETPSETTPTGEKPGLTARSTRSVRPSSAAETSSTIASATSAPTASTRVSRLTRDPESARPSRTASASARSPSCQSGTIAAATLDSSAAATPKAISPGVSAQRRVRRQGSRRQEPRQTLEADPRKREPARGAERADEQRPRRRAAMPAWRVPRRAPRGRQARVHARARAPASATPRWREAMSSTASDRPKMASTSGRAGPDAFSASGTAPVVNPRSVSG